MTGLQKINLLLYMQKNSLELFNLLSMSFKKLLYVSRKENTRISVFDYNSDKHVSENDLVLLNFIFQNYPNKINPPEHIN